MIMADFLILFSLQNSASDKLGRGCKVLRQGGGAIGLPVRGLELGGGSRAPILPHFPNYTFPTQGPLPGNYSSSKLTRLCWCGLVMITMVVVLFVMVVMVVVMLSRMTMVVVMLVMMTMEMVMLFMVVMPEF